MSAQWALAVAQIGTNLLGGLLQAGSMGDIADARQELAQIRNTTVQQQLDQRAEYFTRQRRQYIAQITGAQEVSLAAANVAGGRTARLIEAQTRMQVSRAAEQRKKEIAQHRAESRLGAQTAGKAAALRSDLALQQSLFDALLSGTNTYLNLSQQSQAIQGSGGDSLQTEGPFGLDL